MTTRRPGRPHRPIPRHELLSAAAVVFDREGYGAATLAEVARQVGITKSSLAYHFDSKEALYDELMGGIVSTFVGFVQAALGSGAPWLARLDTLGEAVVRLLGARPEVARLMLRELVDRGPFLQRAGGPQVGQIVALVIAFLDEGVESGHVAPQDTRHLVGSIVAIHLGWFGARGLADAALGADCTADEHVEARVREVIGEVRRLCGGPRGVEPGAVSPDRA